LAKQERIIYDSLNHIIKRLTYEYQSFKEGLTIQTIYFYTDKGEQIQSINKISRYDFWE